MSSGLGDLGDLRDALDRLAAARILLVALDFDGTLSPEVDDPEEARALPEAREAVLRLLALPSTRVAYVSGRAMASLQHVSALPESALLVGSHGVEVHVDGATELVLTAEERSRVAALAAALEAAVQGLDGAWIEAKPAGSALHTRLADEVATTEAARRAFDNLAAVGLDDGLKVRHGKNVIEFSVRSTTKGDAVRELQRRTGATATLFAGDDVTDEDGFRALGPVDLGVKSGPGDTVAGARVAGPPEMAALLAALADRRADHFSTIGG
ncbi:MAG: trehalose-phosphatase [Herbiconiux sp.]|nr:trehalose-phosphatase [Herbiconiux sp.]